METLDFRKVVRSAKDRVFPSVVFIKCVREDMQGGKRQAQEVAGSGVLISADGELLSNWHVVDKATEVRCLLSDGQAFKAKVLGSDKDTDVALLKLERPADAPPCPSRGWASRPTWWRATLSWPWGLLSDSPARCRLVSFPAPTATYPDRVNTVLGSRPTHRSTRATPAARWSTRSARWSDSILEG